MSEAEDDAQSTIEGFDRCGREEMQSLAGTAMGVASSAREAYRSAVMAIPLQARRQAARYGAREAWPWRGHAGRCSRQGGRALAHGQGRHRSIGGAGRTGSRGRGQGESREVQVLSFKDVAPVHRGARGEFAQCPKHRAQWSSTLETYAYPHMGGPPVAAVATAQVMAALEPIWRTKPETANRLRGRIEGVLDYAKARDRRDGENPARWRGHVATSARARKGGPGRASCRAALGRDLHVHAGRAGPRCHSSPCTRIHHPDRGSDWRDARGTVAEIDRKAAVWTVPGARMKAGRDHRVPLSARRWRCLRG